MRTIATVALGAALLVGCATRSAPERADLVLEPQACVDQALPIYFEDGSAALTQPALTLIAETAQRVRACRIAEARLVGLSDAGGSTAENLRLSSERAERVKTALAANGLPAPVLETAAVGEAGALTPAGATPMRRRVEILIKAAPR